MRITVFIFVIALFSTCSTKPTLKNAELSDYFWKVSDYETPKVIVYDFDSLGVVSKNYYLISKTGQNELSMTRFDKDFKEIQYLVYTYQEDEVTLSKASFVEDMKTHLVTDIEIINGVVFSFNDYKRKTEIEGLITLQLEPDITIKNWETTELLDLSDMYIKGKMINTIVAKGYTNRTITNASTGQQQTVRVELETWYSEGIGITLMNQKYPFGAFTDKFDKMISLEEFNNLNSKHKMAK
jgi:hypothetical protein